MLESKIQAKIIKRFTDGGYMVIKLIKTSKNGIPDLMALKDGKVLFVEVKRPLLGKLSKVQEYRIKELKEYGFETLILTE
jgi:Holliday junction resolvase